MKLAPPDGYTGPAINIFTTATTDTWEEKRDTPGGRPLYKTCKWVVNVREIWPNGGGFFRTIPPPP